jgi:2-methylcitrate dehydratase PrpD
MACGKAGKDEPVARILKGVHGAQIRTEGVPVFGGMRVSDATTAALINGATSHALDYDDTHFAHIGHPSVAVFPAVFPFRGTGAQMMWSALIGAEVSVRVGLWLGRSHYQAGFHQTATAGAFGATAAAGLRLGLNRKQMQNAFGLAATQAAGLKSQFGTMGKPYHAGLAARTGLEAASLAKAGFDTRGAGLDGPQGFGPTHHGENNPGAFDDLGTEWRMQTVSHKFHACCHGLHAMLEAITGLTPAPADVEALEVKTHPRWLNVCNIPDPTSGLETKFSFRHTAAMALRGLNTAALNSYTDALAHDPDLAALRQRVTVSADETIPETAAQVALHLTTGQTLTTAHDLAAPITLETRKTRLRTKVRALLGEATEQRLWQATQAEKAPNMDALQDLLA